VRLSLEQGKECLAGDRGIGVVNLAEEQVTADSPAAKAGLKGGDRTVTVQGQQYIIGGDIITKVDDKVVTSFDDLIAYLGTKKPGDKVTLTIVRGDKTLQVPATLKARPSNL